MKILLMMDPGILIPVTGYGGHERLVEMFAKEYRRKGHEVHLLVTSGSTVEGCTVHNFGKEGFPPKKRDARKAIPIAWKFLWKHRHEFDLIHNFGRLVYLLPVMRYPVKKIMTYGREISNRNVDLFHDLKGKNMVYTACSCNLLSRVEKPGNWKVVYNAIEFSKYDLQESVNKDAPLMFLGRIERIKGCHTAIRIARDTNRRLIIAGNISPLPEEALYFKEQIEPFIDGTQIQYVGPVNDTEKNHYLGKCAALLFPIEWNEPFGIVMIEAMACGTPVIAYDRGSVSEVIDNEINGFKAVNYEDLVTAVGKVGSINRRRCASHAAKRFDVSVIALEYLRILKSVRNIVIVTTGQPAANPRVVKEYETLRSAGFGVCVLYTYSAEWSYKADEKKYLSGGHKKKDFVQVGGNPYTSPVSYFVSRVGFKMVKILSGILPWDFLQQMSIARSSLYLWLFASRYRGDAYIAHYLGALPAALKAAQKYEGKVLFDAEDFHRGELPEGNPLMKKIGQMEDRLLPKVDVITAASPLIGARYQQLYPGNKIISINNVFSKRFLQPLRLPGELLTFFWFSQVIGPNRGLEIIVDALNLLDFPVTLSLLGTIREKDFLDNLLMNAKSHVQITLLSPVMPEEVFKIAGTYDIGLAAEIPYCENRDLCLTNKIFTYLMAGNCLLASDTTAQKWFLAKYPSIGLLYQHNDPADLARKISFLNNDRAYLQECKKNALQLSQHYLNWEIEEIKLLDNINELAT